MGIYGEGSFYKTKDGRWVGAVIINGKRKVVTSKNRSTALQKFKQLQQHPNNYSTQNITVQQAFQIYLEDKIVKQTLRLQTEQTQSRIHTISEKKITELKLMDIEKVQQEMSKTLSNRTTNSYISRICTVIKYVAKKHELTVNHNIYNIDKLPVTKTRNSLSLKQIKALVAYIKKQLKNKDVNDVLLFVCLCVFTGARKGEILGLKWSDIDFKNKTINIDKQMKFLSNSDVSGYDFVERVQGNIFLVDLKTKSSYRKIVIADLLLQVLKFRKKNITNNDALLFDYKLYACTLLQDWCKIQKELGICKSDNGFFTLHELRHSCATLMLYLGVSIDVAAKILGHSSVAMTEHYQHLSLELQREAFSRLSVL